MTGFWRFPTDNDENTEPKLSRLQQNMNRLQALTGCWVWGYELGNKLYVSAVPPAFKKMPRPNKEIREQIAEETRKILNKHVEGAKKREEDAGVDRIEIEGKFRLFIEDRSGDEQIIRIHRFEEAPEEWWNAVAEAKPEIEALLKRHGIEPKAAESSQGANSPPASEGFRR